VRALAAMAAMTISACAALLPYLVLDTAGMVSRSIFSRVVDALEDGARFVMVNDFRAVYAPVLHTPPHNDVEFSLPAVHHLFNRKIDIAAVAFGFRPQNKENRVLIPRKTISTRLTFGKDFAPYPGLSLGCRGNANIYPLHIASIACDVVPPIRPTLEVYHCHVSRTEHVRPKFGLGIAGSDCYGILGGLSRARGDGNGSLHVARLLVSEGGEPLSFFVHALGGVPQFDRRDSKDGGEYSSYSDENRLNPSGQINPVAFLWGGFFGGLLIFGWGYELLVYRRRLILGGLVSLCGLALSFYALFWPLLFGGYYWLP